MTDNHEVHHLPIRRVDAVTRLAAPRLEHIREPLASVPDLGGVDSVTSLPGPTASEVHARALQLSAKEVDELLAAGARWQDWLNQVHLTNLAPPGELEIVRRERRGLAGVLNNLQSIAERNR